MKITSSVLGLMLTWLLAAHQFVSHNVKSSFTTPPRYIVDCGWETNCADSIYQQDTWSKFAVCAPYRVRISDSVSRSGSKSVDFILYRTDENCTVKSPSTDTNHLRAELYKRNAYQHYNNYNAWSEYVPVWRDINDDNIPELHAQMHDSDALGSPMWGVSMNKGKYYFSGAIYDKTGAHADSTWSYDMGPVTKSVWTDFIVYCKYRNDCTGELVLYRNGKQAYGKKVKPSYGIASDSINIVVPLKFSNIRTIHTRSTGRIDGPPRINFGIYAWRWPGSQSWNNITAKSVFIDDVRIGDSTNTLEDFLYH
jgi:hypothetical protein